MRHSAASPAYALALITLGYALNIADRFSISTLIEPIKAEMALSDSAVGFLTGVSLALFYVTLGIPLASYADRTNRRNLLAAAIAVWSAMTALCGLAQSYVQLLLARIGVGVGEAGGTPPSASMISDLYSKDRRPLAFSIFALGASLGAWLGSDVAGRLAEAYGWRTAFLALGVPGVALALLLRLSIREPSRGAMDAAGAATGSVVHGLRSTLALAMTRRSVFHLIAGGTILTLWSWGLLWWTPAFLMRSHGMSVGEAGGLLGPMHLIGGTGSLILTAWIMSWRRMTDPRAVLRLIAVWTALATPASVLAYSSDGTTLVVTLWILVASTYFYIGPIMGLLQNLVAPGMRAQVIAVLLFTANVANLVVAPQLIGIASDVLAATTDAGRESLRWCLVALAPTGIWAAWHVWRAERTIVADQADAALSPSAPAATINPAPA